MSEKEMTEIAQSLLGYQSALKQSGSNLEEYIRENYLKKWVGDSLFNAMAVKTTFVNALNNFLTKEGLINLEKVMMSVITDPLAHDVEHTPSIKYKGQTYVTTHSMIYCKFLSCYNPKVKGVFVDSPNIRLEIENPNMKQRGKYLIDFSQMDIELKRKRSITLDEYLNDTERVTKILKEDFETAKDLFERMIVFAMEQVLKFNDENLKALGVTIEIPKQPFPTFLCTELQKKYGNKLYEVKAGEETKSQFFWITGLLRENYDLVYPYLLKNGKVKTDEITSQNIFNYDICAKSILRETGEHTPAVEILSGGIREWLYETIVERLIDNKIISVKPVIKNGNFENIEELGGYAPFLMTANMKNETGGQYFPETFGGGIGIERTLYTLLKGPEITKVDDLTYFGKNPDSHQIYLF